MSDLVEDNWILTTESNLLQHVILLEIYERNLAFE